MADVRTRNTRRRQGNVIDATTQRAMQERDRDRRKEQTAIALLVAKLPKGPPMIPGKIEYTAESPTVTISFVLEDASKLVQVNTDTEAVEGLTS
jgi:hypothetical protein